MKEIAKNQFSKPIPLSPKPSSIVLLITILTNFDLFFRQIAWSDDFAIRADSLKSGGNETFLQITANLRPLYALYLKFAFARVVKEEHIFFLQLFSLVGMVLLGLVLFQILRDRGFSQRFSLFVIFVTNCLPTFQQYTHFATISIFTWVCFGSALAYHLVPHARYTFWPCFLLAAGTLIYPPAALFGLALISIDLAQEISHRGQNLSGALKAKIQRIFLVYGSGTLTGILIAYTVGYFFDVQFAERTKLITNFNLLFEKIQFVVSYLFITSIRPLAIGAGDNRIIALQVLPIMLLIFLTVMSYQEVHKKILILALFIFPLISSASNIVIAENQFEFRTLPGLTFGGFFVCLFLMKLQIQRFFKKISSKIVYSILTLILTFVLVNSQWNSYELWTSPGIVRQEAIAISIPRLSKNVCLYIPSDSIKPLPRLGIYSMRSDLQSSWVTDNIFAFSPNVSRSTKTYVENEIGDCKANDLIIDFSQLGKLPFRKHVW